MIEICGKLDISNTKSDSDTCYFVFVFFYSIELFQTEDCFLSFST